MITMLRASFIIFTACMVLNTAQAAESEGSPVDNKSTYHLSDNVELIAKTAVKYDDPRITIRLAYPKLASTTDVETKPVIVDEDNDNLDAEITGTSAVEAFNNETSTIIREEIALFKQQIAQAHQDQAAASKSKARNRLTVDYSSAIVNLENEPIISIRFIVQGYIGGHKEPIRRYRTLNFDMASGTALQLSDVFKPDSAYLAALGDYASNELSKGSRKKIDLQNDSIPPELLANWNINVNGLRITFDEASIAPRKQGSVSVLIPYKKLKKFVNADSALGRCLKRKNNCMSEHLLTGGFID